MFNGGVRGRKSGTVEKVVERRQRRMIKNRESAARSRARKQVNLFITIYLCTLDCVISQKICKVNWLAYLVVKFFNHNEALNSKRKVSCVK